jgi:enoyl-CoA hydratase/carnithine racemase
LLRSVTDPARLHEFLFLGRTYTPREAAAAGLVNEVVPAERLDERAREVARDLGSRPAMSYRITKELLRGPAAERIREAERGHEELIDAWASPETLAAIRGYLARTLKR